MSSDKKPIMDVSKPGKTPADATSRPIISGHAVLKDPMVNAAEVEAGVTTDALTEGEEAPKEMLAPSAAHKIIKPLEPEAADSEKQEEPESDTDKKSDEPDTEVSDGAVVDAVLDQVTDKKKQEAVDAESQKRQELVDKLVEDKKYFVPIGQERSRRNNRLVLLILGALLPVIVGLGLAADAGAINLGFKVPFDFIKDPKSNTTPMVTPATTEQKVVSTTLPAGQLSKFEDKAGFGLRFTYPSAWKLEKLESNPQLVSKHYGVTLTASDMEVSIISGQGQDIYKAGTLIDEDDCKDLSLVNKPLINGTKLSAVFMLQQKDESTTLPNTKDVNTVLASSGGCSMFKSEEFFMPSIARGQGGAELYVLASLKGSTGTSAQMSVGKLEQNETFKYLRDIVVPSLEFL